MKLFEISNYLNEIVPLDFQEEYDNSGLIIGREDSEIKSVLVCLDCTAEVLAEAIEKGCNLIICHHPLIFNGIKKITSSNKNQKIILKAIESKIAIYAIHTNLDNIYGGVSFKLAEKIGLTNVDFLKPKTGLLTKLTTYCPKAHTEKLKSVLFELGAGKVSDLYDQCAFTSNGTGTFRPLDGSSPNIGDFKKYNMVEEDKIEIVFYSYMSSKIINALKTNHPYEEVSYSTIVINNSTNVGSGAIGKLSRSMTNDEFLYYVKNKLNLSNIRYTKDKFKKQIKKVAVCGGSGRFLLNHALKSKADVFITSDFKYHDFLDVDEQMIVYDIGHFESEVHTQKLIYGILKEKFSKLAVQLSNKCSNPILYY
tara:strand:+ start:1004 stop:2101 length:1098 start_codon:yes stop_codon:yes gene_type:complete